MYAEFLKRFKHNETIANYNKSFKKFDRFLEQEKIDTVPQFITMLNNLDVHLRYEKLQKLIDFISGTVSPRVARNYFDNIFKFLLINGCNLDYTQRRLRLIFPRHIGKEFEGFDQEGIKKCLKLALDGVGTSNNSGSFNFAVYIMFLVGSGTRENEGLRIEPGMIKFDEFPVRILLPGRITKFGIPRETFLPSDTARKLQELIKLKEVPNNKTIFVKEWTPDLLIDFEKYFERIRTKAGLETPNREKHQQNDITLHSFRSYFITTFTDNDLESFGNALAGHSKQRRTYYRKSLETRKRLYGKVMSQLDFWDLIK